MFFLLVYSNCLRALVLYNWIIIIVIQSGKSFVWDVTVVCPLTDSYVASAAREAGSVVELVASKNTDKYTSLAADYHFQPIAVEMLGPINESASHFLTVWAHKISQRSGNKRKTTFLFQCISVLLQQCDTTAFCFTIRLFVRTARSNGHSYNCLH